MIPLPVDEVLRDVLAELVGPGAVVLTAPTGAGKTLRVAPALLSEVSGEVLLVEPRRVAARAAARQIARERGWTLGREVGHHVRFDRRASEDTRLLVVTDGILLRRLQGDPFLEGVGAVVLDEVHERGLTLDLVLALLRQVRREVRPDLRLVVMSATVEAAPLARWLDASEVHASGRTWPVEVRYLPRPAPRPVEDLVADGVRRALAETRGDVLAFLPGAAEIRWTAARLEGLDAEVLPLYGALPAEAQDRALTPGPPGRRRVVLATNLAETSLTVPNITAVVDGGLVRELRFNPGSGLDRLETGRISQASADQRAGRAGRLGPGVAYRLWTERAHAQLAPFPTPEIRRVDLAGPVLQLLAWGEPDPAAFAWLEAPRPEGVAAALALLRRLGAWDGALTEVGRRMARLPVHPRVARMLVEAQGRGCVREGALAAVLLEAREPLRGWTGSGPTASDVRDAVEELARRGGEPVALAQRLARQVRQTLGPPGPTEADGLLRALHAGWPDRLARRRAHHPDRARMIGGRGLDLRASRCDAELLVAVDVDDSGTSDARVRLASAVHPSWLRPEPHVAIRFERGSDRVMAWHQLRVEDLVLAEHPTGDADPDELATVLVREARSAPDRWRPEDPAVEQLLARLDLLRRHMPELALPALTLDDALPEVARGCRSFADLRAAPWRDALLDLLTWSQKTALEQHAPERLQVPSGSRIPLTYAPGRPPVLAVRIQELFGWTETPRLAGGRAPVLLHLLAPNGRPQQITDDLAGFWARTWPEVRKELRARYPRHHWPEDPVRAIPKRK